MKTLTALALATVGTLLGAQAAPAPAPTGPTIKFRGSIWASGVYSDHEIADGTVPFRGFLDQNNGGFALDGATLGADITLPANWSIKVTALGGTFAKVLNMTDSPNGEDRSSLALCEAQLIYTGASDTFKIGRMWTPLGMEVADQSANIAASRGILFSNVLPLSQVGINWHHAFSASFSTDVYAINGEDKVTDNNQGKTYGLQFTYNHGGASDKFATLLLFRGPEQDRNLVDGTGNMVPNLGVEGRQRERVSFSGQWVWGATTLQWEADKLDNPDLNGEKAKTTGFGFILKQQFTDIYAGFLRAETMKTTYLNDDSKLSAYCVGLERKWGPTFARLELRHDNADKDAYTATDGKTFKDANSATISLGTSF
ncbi:MAG TPA: outer membrane beta-barrel protein [Holophaga sp.]|nr:outer membrane beta-barrel protein [Holophaga sp.]